MALPNEAPTVPPMIKLSAVDVDDMITTLLDWTLNAFAWLLVLTYYVVIPLGLAMGAVLWLSNGASLTGLLEHND